MHKLNFTFLVALIILFICLWAASEQPSLLWNRDKDGASVPIPTPSSPNVKQEIPPNYLCRLNPSAIYSSDRTTVPTLSSYNAGKELTPDNIYNRISPSIAKIKVPGRGGGAGIIFADDGLVLTSYHVLTRPHIVEDLPENISAQLKDGRKFTGTVIGKLEQMDLALIQLKGAYGLPTVPLADKDSDRISFGETVYAIGFPNGMKWLMTRGKFVQLRKYYVLTTRSGLVAQGSSGGALINSSGQVIGITRACNLDNGEGWHVSIRWVRAFINEVKRLKPQYFKSKIQ